MHQLGLIAEYNPLHRGHLFQIRYLREKLGPKSSLTVALASNFCQRGEPALLDVPARARMAIRAGADLVLLLPQAFSSGDGETYARAGVRLLGATGVVKSLVASSEVFDKDLLQKASQLISPESPDLKSKIRENIRQGYSPHQARLKALSQLDVDPQILACFNLPNARLVIEYLAQIEALDPTSRLGFFLCPRQSPAQARDLAPAWSATKIRKICQEEAGISGPLSPAGLSKLREEMPPSSLAILLAEVHKGRTVLPDKFIAYARQLVLRTESLEDLRSYRYMENGLAERLYRWAKTSDPLSLVEAKNFPAGRVRRALVSLALNLHREACDLYLQGPAFIYPLAYNKQGKYLLRRLGERSSLPLVGRFSEALNHSDPQVRYQAELERRSWSLYSWLQDPSSQENKLLDPPQELKTWEI